MLYLTRRPTPLGPMTLACDDRALVGAWFEGQAPVAGMAPETLGEWPQAPLLKLASAWLDAYFAGKRPTIAGLSLAPMGSPFRKMVWKRLCAIPYGECVTYGELARELAAATQRSHMSAQAVGGAVGHNPIAIIIPCHRVMGARGNLTGYGGGVEKKLWLLQREGVETRQFFLPQRPAGRRAGGKAQVVTRPVQV